MMINFVRHASQEYAGIVDAHIAAITRHLSKDHYSIGPISLQGHTNVHLFNEDWYTDWVGLRGVNVFISHGIADKNYRNYRDVKKFDYVFVSGPRWVNKLVGQGCSSSRIKVVGYPRLDAAYRTRSRTQGVLWAPTHAGPGGNQNASYLASGYPRMEKLVDPTWATSQHPANRGARQLTNMTNASVVIADSGSTMYEAWALGKPVVLPTWLVGDVVKNAFAGSFEADVYNESIGYHVNHPDALHSVVQQALQDGITEKEEEFIESILPTSLRGCSGEAMAQALRKVR